MYLQEAIAPPLTGTITIGARAGYEGNKEYSLEETLTILSKINHSFSNTIWQPINSIINEAHLVGRSGNSGYQEKLYQFNFSQSPRAKPISHNRFFETLCEYAYRLGTEMQQVRVYIDHNQNTIIYKQDQQKDEQKNNNSFPEEQQLKEIVTQYLLKGRPNWDLPHTLQTVDAMKSLVQAEGGNNRVLVSAMYLHDTGWSGLFDSQTCSYNTIENGQELHMQRSAENARTILPQLNYHPNEIEQITHLVRIHDKLEALESPYEILVMEADTLGQLSTPQQGTNFSAEDYTRFVQYLKTERQPRFQTETGKKILFELL